MKRRSLLAGALASVVSLPRTVVEAVTPKQIPACDADGPLELEDVHVEVWGTVGDVRLQLGTAGVPCVVARLGDIVTWTPVEKAYFSWENTEPCAVSYCETFAYIRGLPTRLPWVPAPPVLPGESLTLTSIGDDPIVSLHIGGHHA